MGVAEAAPRGSGKRCFRDYVALGIATCGVGYIPLAPGTWGSAVGVVVYLSFRFFYTHFQTANVSFLGQIYLQPYLQVVGLLLLVVLSLIGIWAASRAESLFGKKDPGAVVIDEVIGQLITFLSVPITIKPWTIFAGFLTFRAFDICKPYPIRRLEGLKSGLGIIADDVLAGAYSAVILSAIFALGARVV